MQKQRIFEVERLEDPSLAFPPPRARPAPRLADDSDVAVVAPARRLQDDLAHAFAADARWSVKRTVIVGLVFHVAILGSLALAAGGLLPQIMR